MIETIVIIIVQTIVVLISLLIGYGLGITRNPRNRDE